MPKAKPKEEYPEIKVPQPEVKKSSEGKKEFSPGKMRRFMRHLSSSSTKVESQLKARADVRQRLDKIKSMALNKRTKKHEIEKEFGDFQSLVNEIVKDENKILEEQRKESQEVRSLKEMVEGLSQKLVQLGKEYALEMEKKDNKIVELRESLAAARMKAAEAKSNRDEKIQEIEKRIKKKADKDKQQTVKEVESHLKTLEDTHAKLKKSGKHPKKDLDRLAKIIDTHKKKLSKLK